MRYPFYAIVTETSPPDAKYYTKNAQMKTPLHENDIEALIKFVEKKDMDLTFCRQE